MTHDELRSVSISQLAAELKKKKGGSLEATLAELQKLHCGRNRGTTGQGEINWEDIPLKHLTLAQLKQLIGSSNGKSVEIAVGPLGLVGPFGLWGRKTIRASDRVYKKPSFWRS